MFDLIAENSFIAHIYVYIIVYMGTILFLQFLCKEKTRLNIIRCLSVLLVLIVSYEFSQRDYSIGTDTNNYKFIYEYISTDIKQVLEEKEVAFYWI